MTILHKAVPAPKDKTHDDDELVFTDDGIIEWSAYSYHIDETGCAALDADRTKALYEAMKNFTNK